MSQEEIRKFWEAWGFTFKHDFKPVGFDMRACSRCGAIEGGLFKYCNMPPIDLNSLFQYCMSRLNQWDKAKVLSEWSTEISNSDIDPAIALYQALSKIKPGRSDER